jgi:LPS-assembly protein
MGESILKAMIALSIVLLFVLSSFSQELDIAADSLEYFEDYGNLNAKGNIILNWEGKRACADYIEFIVDEKIINAHGNVSVKEGNNIIHANSATYDYDHDVGTMKEVFGYHSNMFIRAESIERHGKNIITMEKIRISNCDLDNPHTYFKASHGKIVLDKRITIYNAVLYVGGVPVFYLPIITQFLDAGLFGVDLKFKLGFGSGGFHFKTTASCALGKFFTGKAIFDYLCSGCVGYGAEIDYVEKNAIGKIYAYTNHNLLDGKKKEIIKSSYFNKINNQWTIQSKGDFIKNKYFDSFYYGEKYDWDRIEDLLQSYVSVTRQGQNTNLRFSIENNRIYDYVDDKSMFNLKTQVSTYKTLTSTLPSVDLVYFPKKIFLDITRKLSFQYSNILREYSPKNYFYKNENSLNCSLTKNFNFGKKFTLTPTLEVIENWHDKNNSGVSENIFNIKYGGSLNSRFRVTNWMDWNVKYSLRVGSKDNSLNINDSLSDYRTEINNVIFDNQMYLGDKAIIRNTIKHDFGQNSKKTPKKLLSLVTELEWNPKHCMTVYAKQTQFIEPCEFKSLEFDTIIGKPEKKYLNFGIFYQNHDELKVSCKKHKVDNVLGFGVYLTPKWRLNYNIKTTFLLDLSYSRMNEHELNLYRDLHCYNLSANWNIRKNEHKFYLKFDLKSNMPFDKSKRKL